jgi:hypothetical protein
LGSEAEFHRELDLALGIGGTGDNAEVGISQSALRSSKYHVVRHVKKVTTEFKVGPFFYGEAAE